MTEAIELLEKQLQSVRNSMQGTRDRIDKLDDELESSHGIMEALKQRETLLNNAIRKLRE